MPLGWLSECLFLSCLRWLLEAFFRAEIVALAPHKSDTWRFLELISYGLEASQRFNIYIITLSSRKVLKITLYWLQKNRYLQYCITFLLNVISWTFLHRISCTGANTRGSGAAAHLCWICGHLLSSQAWQQGSHQGAGSLLPSGSSVVLLSSRSWFTPPIR